MNVLSDEVRVSGSSSPASVSAMVSCATRTVLAVGLLSARTTGLVVQSRMSGKRARDVAMSASERVYVSRTD